MMKRTEEMKLSSAGLLLLLTAAAMTLFADFDPKSKGFARAPTPLHHGLK